MDLDHSSLEVLVIGKTDKHVYDYFGPWKLPRLRSLLIDTCVYWRRGNFGNLRQLIIEGEDFDVAGMGPSSS